MNGTRREASWLSNAERTATAIPPTLETGISGRSPPAEKETHVFP